MYDVPDRNDSEVWASHQMLEQRFLLVLLCDLPQICCITFYQPFFHFPLSK
jgi:hypothetical protein